MLLNCDLGESYGSWRMGWTTRSCPSRPGQRRLRLPRRRPPDHGATLALAASTASASAPIPSYPDLVGFGRRSMALSADELRATLHYQIAALDGMAAIAGIVLAYVKPHGALYNDMMADAAVRETVMAAVAAYPRPLRLMLQATTEAPTHRREANKHGLALWFEAFADRCYDDDGRLLSRRKPGAVHDRDRMLAQVRQLAEDRSVTTVSGARLELEIDTLCVHGDNAEGVRAIADIRELLTNG
jgi:UPF0271 protein